jgi:hypothetical protein
LSAVCIFLAGCSLNTTLVLQILYYGRKNKATKAKAKAVQKKKQ